MADANQTPRRLSFGPFEVDASARQLFKSGIRVRLPGQPFEILMELLKTPGEVVTREHLRTQIWKDGTFVDFEHGLNAAMNKLRRALGDSAENPRYIETVCLRCSIRRPPRRHLPPKTLPLRQTPALPCRQTLGRPRGSGWPPSQSWLSS